MKAFFKKVWFPFGVFFGFIGTVLKWLDKNTPMWILNDVIIGAVVGGVIYAVLGHYLGHGLTAEQVAAGLVATSPFHAWAIPAGIFFGIFIAVWLLYWDVWAIRKYGKR